HRRPIEPSSGGPLAHERLTGEEECARESMSLLLTLIMIERHPGPVHDQMPDLMRHIEAHAGRILLCRGTNDDGAGAVYAEGVDFGRHPREVHYHRTCIFSNANGRGYRLIERQSPMRARAFRGPLGILELHHVDLRKIC